MGLERSRRLKMSVNRRKFIYKHGRVIETNFDVYWCAVDENGERWVYAERPKEITSSGIWYWDILLRERVDYITPPKNWRTCRWYLRDDGKWVKR
jgi:hypothetical protein